MTHLVLVGDSAYPPDIGNLPKDIVALCGYIGGDTPHVWTVGEVSSVLAKGLMWWPIYTAPSSPKTVNGAIVWPKLTAALGKQHGIETLRILENPYGALIHEDYPIFNDIEYGTYMADPQGALEYLVAWKEVLLPAGRKPYGYLPWQTQIDWVANWTNIRPSQLPINAIGWQFGGYKAPNVDIDLSVFDLDKIGVANAMQDININTISPNAAHAIAVAMLEASPAAINGYAGRVADILTGDAASLTQILGELQSLNSNIQALAQTLTGGKPNGQGG